MLIWRKNKLFVEFVVIMYLDIDKFYFIVSKLKGLGEYNLIKFC